MIFDRRDISPAGRELAEWDTLCWADELRHAQYLVQSNIVPSYLALGLRTADGQVPNWLLRAVAFLTAVTEEAWLDRGVK